MTRNQLLIFLLVLDVLGSVAFTPVKSDMLGNVKVHTISTQISYITEP